MAQDYKTLTLEAVKFLCGHINKIVNLPTDVISDTSIATNTTYSSYKLDLEIDNVEKTLTY